MDALTLLRRGGLVVGLCLALTAIAAQAGAQTVQVSPFGGYRLGDEPYCDAVPDDADVGSGASFGAMLDVFFEPSRAVTFLYSHSDDLFETTSPGLASPVRVSFDHFLVGGTDEFGGPRVKPFLLGAVGLTHLYGGGDSEVRFTAGGGGGVKLLPTRHLGIRLDGRLYAIFLGGEGSGGFCTGGACFIRLDVSVMWQAEFTAGIVFSF